jgi:transcriptional regulator with XRE-family HTH domain
MTTSRRTSRLQVWLGRQSFTARQLEVATGISRGHLRKIRQGGNLTMENMLRILAGARVLAGRRVHVLELFDLQSDDAQLPLTN